jgi:hypothetical protein
MYTGIATALPLGHETYGALVGARAGTQIAGRYGGLAGGAFGYVAAIAIMGGIVTAIDPADLYEGGLAEWIPPHVSEPAIAGFKEGYRRGPLTTSPHLRFIKETLGENAAGVKQDLWTEPKEFLVKYW